MEACASCNVVAAAACRRLPPTLPAGSLGAALWIMHSHGFGHPSLARNASSMDFQQEPGACAFLKYGMPSLGLRPSALLGRLLGPTMAAGVCSSLRAAFCVQLRAMRRADPGAKALIFSQVRSQMLLVRNTLQLPRAGEAWVSQAILDDFSLGS